MVLATVYYWNLIIGQRVGHLSLELSDRTYISWWPENAFAIKKGSKAKTLEDDVLSEGGHPNEYYIRLSIDSEFAIKNWWEKYKSTSEWRLFTNNCAQVVQKALNIGLYWQTNHNNEREYGKHLSEQRTKSTQTFFDYLALTVKPVLQLTRLIPNITPKSIKDRIKSTDRKKSADQVERVIRKALEKNDHTYQPYYEQYVLEYM